MVRRVEISMDGKIWHAVVRYRHDVMQVGFRIRLDVTPAQCVAAPHAGQTLHVIFDRVLRSTGRVCEATRSKRGWRLTVEGMF